MNDSLNNTFRTNNFTKNILNRNTIKYTLKNNYELNIFYKKINYIYIYIK